MEGRAAAEGSDGMLKSGNRCKMWFHSLTEGPAFVERYVKWIVTGMTEMLVKKHMKAGKELIKIEKVYV